MIIDKQTIRRYALDNKTFKVKCKSKEGLWKFMDDYYDMHPLLINVKYDKKGKVNEFIFILTTE